MGYHIIAFFLGFVLDMILGDPYSFPHPIRLIGRKVSGLERSLLNEEGCTLNSGDKEKKEPVQMFSETGKQDLKGSGSLSVEPIPETERNLSEQNHSEEKRKINA